MVRFLISIAFWGVAFIRGRHLLDSAAYFDLSVKKCGNYLEASSHSQMFFKIGVFKIGLPPPKKKVCYLLVIERPFKIMKNAFYFVLKALFILKGFKFLSRLFGHVGKATWLQT